MLAIVAMVVARFLFAVGRVVGRAEIKQDPLRRAAFAALLDVELAHSRRYPVADAGAECVLHPRDWGLARQVHACLGQPPAREFQERLGA